MMFGGSVQKKD